MGWGQKRGVDDICKALLSNTTPETQVLFSTRTFGAPEAKRLCKALATNTSLRELLCSGHAIGSEGAAAFAAALASNTALTSLSLGSSSFGDCGVQALCVGLRSNTSLQRLDLEYKGFNLGGAAALGATLGGALGPRLVELKLGRNSFGDAGLAALAAGLAADSTLRVLELQECGVGVGGVATFSTALSSGSSNLRRLVLSGNPDIGDEGAACLGAMLLDSAPSASESTYHAWELRLDGCGIGNAGAKALAGSVAVGAVRSLVLCDSCIAGEEGGSVLGTALASPTCCLEELELRGNKLGLGGATALADGATSATDGEGAARPPSSLRRLDLSHNQIRVGSPADADRLRSLADLPGLNELQLLGNALGDAGAVSVVSSSVSSPSTLQVLGLAGTGVEEAGVLDLCELLRSASSSSSRLRVVEIGGNKGVGTTGGNAALEKLREERTELEVVVGNVPTTGPGDNPLGAQSE